MARIIKSTITAPTTKVADVCRGCMMETDTCEVTTCHIVARSIEEYRMRETRILASRNGCLY